MGKDMFLKPFKVVKLSLLTFCVVCQGRDCNIGTALEGPSETILTGFIGFKAFEEASALATKLNNAWLEIREELEVQKVIKGVTEFPADRTCDKE